MSFNLIRLEPPIIVYTPLGEAEAHFLQVPFGSESHSFFGVFQCETKECWWWPNTMIRLYPSISAERTKNMTDFNIDDGYLENLKPHILRHKLSPLFIKVASAKATSKDR